MYGQCKGTCHGSYRHFIVVLQDFPGPEYTKFPVYQTQIMPYLYLTLPHGEGVLLPSTRASSGLNVHP